ARELGEKVLVDSAENIFGAVLFVAKTDRAVEIDQLAEAMLVQRRSRVIFRQHTFEPRIVAFDLDHSIIYDLAERRLLRIYLQIRPSSFLRQPKDILGPIFVRILRIRAGVVALASRQFRAMLLERI